MPRVNRAIELLRKISLSTTRRTTISTYENGKALASTWADFINVDMEHHPFDVAGLQRVHAGPRRRRPDQERPPHPGRDRRRADHGARRGTPSAPTPG